MTDKSLALRGTATRRVFSRFFDSEEGRNYLRLAHDAMGAYAVSFVGSDLRVSGVSVRPLISLGLGLVPRN